MCVNGDSPTAHPLYPTITQWPFGIYSLPRLVHSGLFQRLFTRPCQSLGHSRFPSALSGGLTRQRLVHFALARGCPKTSPSLGPCPEASSLLARPTLPRKVPCSSVERSVRHCKHRSDHQSIRVRETCRIADRAGRHAAPQSPVFLRGRAKRPALQAQERPSVLFAVAGGEGRHKGFDASSVLEVVLNRGTSKHGGGASNLTFSARDMGLSPVRDENPGCDTGLKRVREAVSHAPATPSGDRLVFPVLGSVAKLGCAPPTYQSWYYR